MFVVDVNFEFQVAKRDVIIGIQSTQVVFVLSGGAYFVSQKEEERKYTDRIEQHE